MTPPRGGFLWRRRCYRLRFLCPVKESMFKLQKGAENFCADKLPQTVDTGNFSCYNAIEDLSVINRLSTEFQRASSRLWHSLRVRSARSGDGRKTIQFVWSAAERKPSPQDEVFSRNNQGGKNYGYFTNRNEHGCGTCA